MDMRIFRVDFPEFFPKIGDMSELRCVVSHYMLTWVGFVLVKMLTTEYRPWGDEGPQQVIEEANKRINTEGWTSVRPALSTTIRMWMLRGLFEGKIYHHYDVGVEFIGRALELLNAGNRIWKDVPQRTRGAVFHESFVRGVRDWYLDTCIAVCCLTSAMPVCSLSRFTGVQ